MPGGEVAAAAAEVASTVAETAAQAAPAAASATESAVAAGTTAAAETAGQGVVSAAQGASTTVAEQATNTGLAASVEQVTQTKGPDVALNTLANKDSWGVPEAPGTSGAKLDSSESAAAPGAKPDVVSDSPVTSEPTAEAGQQLEEAGVDAGGLKPGDRSYDAIIAEGDAKRAFEAAKADPTTSPEDLARLEREYKNATGERQEAVADRDKATIDARTEEIKREVTESVKQEFQGQIDKLSLSNVELRQALAEMGQRVGEAMEKTMKYVDEKEPEKKKSLKKILLELIMLISTVVVTEVGGQVKEGTTSQRRQ